MAERFWWGPVITPAHARKITRYVAIGWIVIGALIFAVSLSQRDQAMTIVSLLFLLPGWELLRNAALLAARIMLGFSIFGVAAAVLFGGGAFAQGVSMGWLWTVLFWLVTAWAAARAGKAAKALRLLKSDPASAFD